MCLCVCDLSAMPSGGLCCQILDFLSIKRSRSAVVFGVGRAGVTPVLTEEGALREKPTTRGHHRRTHLIGDTVYLPSI